MKVCMRYPARGKKNSARAGVMQGMPTRRHCDHYYGLIDEESDRSVCRSCSARGRKPFHFSCFSVAFSVERETAELEITDWADGQDPGGPVGQRLFLDFLQVKPLFMGLDGPARN